MKYLLIFGALRSGKTLIGRALNMHPNVVAQKEPYFFYFKICRNIFYRDILKKSEFDPDFPMDTDFCKPMQEKEIFRNSFININFMENDIEELKRLTVKHQDAEPGERAPKILPLLNKLKPGPAHLVFKQLMDFIGESYSKSGVIYVGITEGWCDEFIAPMLKLNDIDVHCIHCLRDPRSIVASRNAGKNVIESYGGKYPLLFLIRHWRKTIAYSILNNGNHKYLAVKYEQVVQEPEICFSRICEFLNIPFSENLLKPHTFVKGDGSLWKQNTSYQGNEKNSFSTGSLEKWKDVLSKEEIGVIEYLCEAEMDYIGLERVNTNFNVRGLFEFREDEDVIVEWLRNYNWIMSDKEITLEIVRKVLIEERKIVKLPELANYFAIEEDVFDVLSNHY